jgi:hypothetical protein
MELLIHDKKIAKQEKCSGISFSDTLKKHGAKLGMQAWKAGHDRERRGAGAHTDAFLAK